MTAAYVGELSIGASIPGVVGVLATAMADLQAKVDAMAAFALQLGLPALTISAQLDIALSIVAALEASIALGITPPNISAQLSIVVAALLQLQLELSVFIGLFNLLASGGVFAYTLDGPTNTVGSDLSAALSSGFPGHGASDHANVLVLGTVSSATWSAMSAVFKTS